MPADREYIKLDGARVSIGLFSDIEHTIWKILSFTFWEFLYYEPHDHEVRRLTARRTRLVRNIVEEGAIAIEDWIDKQLATGKSIRDVRSLIQQGFRFDVVTSADAPSLHPGIVSRRCLRQDQRQKDRKAVRQLIEEASAEQS